MTHPTSNTNPNSAQPLQNAAQNLGNAHQASTQSVIPIAILVITSLPNSNTVPTPSTLYPHLLEPQALNSNAAALAYNRGEAPERYVSREPPRLAPRQRGTAPQPTTQQMTRLARSLYPTLNNTPESNNNSPE